MNGAEFLNATLQVLHAFLFCFVSIDQKMVYYRFYSFYRLTKSFWRFLCLILSIVSVSNLIYLGHKCWVFRLFLLLYNISLASFRVLITPVDDTSFFYSGL